MFKPCCVQRWHFVLYNVVLQLPTIQSEQQIFSSYNTNLTQYKTNNMLLKLIYFQHQNYTQIYLALS